MRKEDLREYRHICEELNQLAEERLEWRTRAERSTVSPSKAPVLGGEHDPMPMIADRLAAIRTQADSLVRRLADAKLRVERAIDGLPSVQRRLMRARYIEGKSWLEVVEETSISEPVLYRLHKLALSNITKKQAKRRDNGVRPQKRSEYRAASE